MTALLKNKVQLFYVYDPMCSWCWGYRPTWLALQNALKATLPDIEISYLLGGLAPDSEQPMSQDMQQFIETTWQKIARQLNTQFNFDFWQQNQARRSTYPACRACLLARESNKELEMIFSIQQAYYLQAKNPSDNSLLITLASQIGLQKSVFSEQLSAPLTQQKLMTEIDKAHALPIQGFPSLVLTINDQNHAIPIDYQQWQHSFDTIKQILQC
ncbi:MAG: DsbA family protein [Psychromonas sp.]